MNDDPAATLKDLTESIAFAIHDMRKRPDMWVQVYEPYAFDALLHAYHQLWASAERRYAEFRRVYENVLADEGCRCVGFVHGWQARHPEGSKKDATEFVFVCWQKVTERLGIERPAWP